MAKRRRTVIRKVIRHAPRVHVTEYVDRRGRVVMRDIETVQLIETAHDAPRPLHFVAPARST